VKATVAGAFVEYSTDVNELVDELAAAGAHKAAQKYLMPAHRAKGATKALLYAAFGASSWRVLSVGTLLGGVCVASKKIGRLHSIFFFKKWRVNSTNKKPSPMDSSAGAEGISFPAFRGILGDSQVLTDFLPPLIFFRRFTFTFSKKC
jgi:hypothetical protein